MRALAAALLLAGCAMPAGDAAADEGLARGSYAVPALGLRVSYLRAGKAGARRVVFVHGTPGDAAGWAGFLHDAPADLDFIAVDRPGFGQTTPPGALPSLVAQARALAPLLAGPGAPPILVGHSYGGPVIAMAAALYPRRVGGLLILAGALDPAQEHVMAIQYAGEWPGIRALVPRQWRNANRELIPLREQLQQLAPLLDRVTAPVTIVHGTADELVPIANVAYMAPRFRHARAVTRVILPGQSHFLPWEHRPLIERLVRRMAHAA